MVTPSDVWCKENGYFRTGSPDYKAALSSCVDLINVISKINNLMSDRGFPLENMESILKNLATSEVENAIMRSQEDGSGLQESSLDRLYRLAQTDIVLQLTWNINTMGPKHSVTFNLKPLTLTPTSKWPAQKVQANHLSQQKFLSYWKRPSYPTSIHFAIG